MARTGRRPGSEDTRGDILVAARSVFAERGFQAATVRSIAGAAGVDPALVHHYFGTKEDLFAAAIEFPFKPADAAAVIMADGIEGAGASLVRLFLSVWDTPDSRQPLLAVLRSAFIHEQAAATLRDFLNSVIFTRIAPHLEGEDVELRLSLAGSQLIGMALLRYVVKLEPLHRASVEDLVELIGPRIQSYFTG